MAAAAMASTGPGRSHELHPGLHVGAGVQALGPAAAAFPCTFTASLRGEVEQQGFELAPIWMSSSTGAA